MGKKIENPAPPLQRPTAPPPPPPSGNLQLRIAALQTALQQKAVECRDCRQALGAVRIAVGRHLMCMNPQCAQYHLVQFAEIHDGGKDVTMPTRAHTLLKAAYDLLKQCNQAGYVLEAIDVEIEYDGTTCDGYCLLEDLAAALNIPKEDYDR